MHPLRLSNVQNLISKFDVYQIVYSSTCLAGYRYLRGDAHFSFSSSILFFSFSSSFFLSHFICLHSVVKLPACCTSLLNLAVARPNLTMRSFFAHVVSRVKPKYRN